MNTTTRAGGGAEICERTFQFALRVMRVVQSLPRSAVGGVLARQLLRSGTSIGANVEEAQAAHSRQDFIRRMNIANGEARETRYWLRLLAESDTLDRERLIDLQDEAEQIMNVIFAIVRNTRRRTPCAAKKPPGPRTPNS